MTQKIHLVSPKLTPGLGIAFTAEFGLASIHMSSAPSPNLVQLLGLRDLGLVDSRG